MLDCCSCWNCWFEIGWDWGWVWKDSVDWVKDWGGLDWWILNWGNDCR